MKNFLYLVQGESKLVKNYFHLANRAKSDAIFLTYDKKIENTLFFPNSTWTDGRNKLLKVALTKSDYQYYIFCDDDIAFQKGDWDKFEKQLITLRPAIAVPVFVPKTFKTTIPGFKYQSFLFNDEQFIAFHKDVVRDGIVLPYQTKFDDITWWAACEIQQILIQNFYYSNSIQFNKIHISNECRLRYSNLKSDIFREELAKWSDNQFKGNYKNIKMSAKRNIIKILWRTFRFSIQQHYNKKTTSYRIDEKIIRNLLLNDSELLKQYFNLLLPIK